MMNKVPKDVDYCNMLINTLPDKKDTSCFDDIKPTTVAICDAIFKISASKHSLRNCYGEAVFLALDANFCETQYAGESKAF